MTSCRPEIYVHASLKVLNLRQLLNHYKYPFQNYFPQVILVIVSLSIHPLQYLINVMSLCENSVQIYILPEQSPSISTINQKGNASIAVTAVNQGALTLEMPFWHSDRHQVQIPT